MNQVHAPRSHTASGRRDTPYFSPRKQAATGKFSSEKRGGKDFSSEKQAVVRKRGTIIPKFKRVQFICGVVTLISIPSVVQGMRRRLPDDRRRYLTYEEHEEQIKDRRDAHMLATNEPVTDTLRTRLGRSGGVGGESGDLPRPGCWGKVTNLLCGSGKKSKNPDYGLIVSSRGTPAFQADLDDELLLRMGLKNKITKVKDEKRYRCVIGEMGLVAERINKHVKADRYNKSDQFCWCKMSPEEVKKLDKEMKRCLKCGKFFAKCLAAITCCLRR